MSVALRELSKKHAGTLFTTLLAAYQILLFRYTGQDDISVGSPMPGRTRSGLDGIVGDFVNPVVFKKQFLVGETVSGVLRSVRSSALRGIANQEYPFSALVEELRPLRSPGHHPFYQTMFVFQNARKGHDLRALWDPSSPDVHVAFGNVQLSPYPVYQGGGADAMRLQLEAIELDHGIRCDFNFDSAVFDRSTIDRLVNAWTRVLDGMVR
ncbi:MAG: hypothetical protein EKK62_11340, partial [Acidimicrobiia bacterium]